MFKNEDKCYSQRHVSWVWLKVRTKRAANILEKKILKRSYLPVRNVKQNIHSPQRHKGTISSGTQVCQVLLPLSSTPLVCSPHCHYPCSGKLDKVCFSPDEELWMCKREPFWQKSVYRGQLLHFLLHRHLATGGSRNRIRHKSEFKKKPLWFERTTAKNPQMPMREHKVCKSEWTPTSSKAHSGAADPREKNIWCYQHRTMNKHFFQAQETSLHNTGCSTAWKVPGGHKWEGRSCSWFGTNSKDAPGTDHGMCHRAPVHSWSEASGNQVRGVWNESKHTNSKL